MVNRDITIRKIKLSDFSEIFSLWQKAGLGLSDKNMEFSDLRLTIKKNPNSCFVLIKDKKIIGSVLGTFNGRRGWIYHLAVDPDYQHEGYGSLLLIKAEKELKKQGAHRIHLGVLYTNLKVLPFYEKYEYDVVNDALWLGKNI